MGCHNTIDAGVPETALIADVERHQSKPVCGLAKPAAAVGIGHHRQCARRNDFTVEQCTVKSDQVFAGADQSAASPQIERSVHAVAVVVTDELMQPGGKLPAG